MANAILTPTAVTREALRVLHQKLNFVGSITREYDDSFARQNIALRCTVFALFVPGPFSRFRASKYRRLAFGINDGELPTLL